MPGIKWENHHFIHTITFVETISTRIMEVLARIMMTLTGIMRKTLVKDFYPDNPHLILFKIEKRSADGNPCK
jgi:hypothetical protein